MELREFLKYGHSGLVTMFDDALLGTHLVETKLNSLSEQISRTIPHLVIIFYHVRSCVVMMICRGSMVNPLVAFYFLLMMKLGVLNLSELDSTVEASVVYRSCPSQPISR